MFFCGLWPLYRNSKCDWDHEKVLQYPIWVKDLVVSDLFMLTNIQAELIMDIGYDYPIIRIFLSE